MIIEGLTTDQAYKAADIVETYGQLILTPNGIYFKEYFYTWAQFFKPRSAGKLNFSLSDTQLKTVSSFYDRVVSQTPIIIYIKNGVEVELTGLQAVRFFRPFLPVNPITWVQTSTGWECSNPRQWVCLDLAIRQWCLDNGHILWFFSLGNMPTAQRRKKTRAKGKK